MASKTPLSLVKEKFGDKAKLVEALEKLTSQDLWVARTNKNKGLGRVSNVKLLRLHATFAEVKEKFGTRDKLIDALLDTLQRSKDAGFRQRVSEWPVPRLVDAYKSAMRRNSATRETAPAAGAAPAKSKAATPGAQAKGSKEGSKKAETGAKPKPRATTATKAAPKTAAGKDDKKSAPKADK
jgi:hypothetical protein